ncbi:MAG TPA: bifunctional nuclease domain-containing protein [archaeon]|nr:bifunctional nuclease domain-containing protein [archaeon]
MAMQKRSWGLGEAVALLLALALIAAAAALLLGWLAAPALEGAAAEGPPLLGDSSSSGQPAASAGAGGQPAAEGVESRPELPELRLEGYVPVEVNLTETTVILTAECLSIEAETTEAQTFSIAKGLEGRLDFRPTTHDLMQDLMDHYGIIPLQARIDRYDQGTGTYYAQLVVRSGERVLSLDSRPTDAIGVAVRYGLPVHMNRAVLESQGERVC